MIGKWKINLIAFLISLTLFSVGFSSWQITNSVTHTEDGTIKVDSVVNAPSDVSKLVKFNSVVCFEYSKTGFIHRTDNQITRDKTGTVTANFTLYPQELKSHFSNYSMTSLSFEAVLTYSNATADLFGANCSAYTPTATLGTTALDCPSTAHTNTEYKFTATLTDILISTETEINYTMNFTFTVTDNTAYTAFYNAINNDNFTFNVSANISTYAERAG